MYGMWEESGKKVFFLSVWLIELIILGKYF